MNLLLISKTPIIKQIFNLVAIKLELNLTVTDVKIVNEEYDLIVVEDELFDSEFPLKSYAKKFGIISKDIDSIKSENDFLISRPFMPSTLLLNLEEQILSMQSSVSNNTEVDTSKDFNSIKEELNSEDAEEISDSEDFLDSLAEDISSEIEEENDESIISTSVASDGGILDSKELSKIQDILDFNDNNTFQLDKEHIEDEDWIDLSDIIDKAIDEVREYQFKENTPVKLVLNDYSMNELSPLLHKLDQNIIDALTSGEEINLKLKLEKN